MEIDIKFFDSITSTNEIAVQNSIKDKEFTIYLANYQTKGRGRNNRNWYSPPGENLYFSFILKPKIKTSLLSVIPILAGYSVLKTIERYLKGKKVYLKWPNDLIVNNKKICGILTEYKNKTVIVGIGLNINSREFPELEGNVPTSLIKETGKYFDRLNILLNFMKNFKDIYQTFLKFHEINSPILKEINEKLYLKDKIVEIKFKDKSEKGIVNYINKDGALVISGKKIYAGEIIKIEY